MSKIENAASVSLIPFVRREEYQISKITGNRCVVQWSLLRARILEELYPPEDRGVPSELLHAIKYLNPVTEANISKNLDLTNRMVFFGIYLGGHVSLGGFNHLVRTPDPRIDVHHGDQSIVIMNLGSLMIMVVTGAKIVTHVALRLSSLKRCGFYDAYTDLSELEVMNPITDETLERATTIAFFNQSGSRRKMWETC